MSWNRKDWLKLAGLLGLGATGAGLAGVGPMAGLLGGTGQALSAGASGASLAPGLAGPTTQGAGGAMGLGAAFNKGMGTMSAVAKPMMAVNAATGMLGGGQTPPPAPPPPSAPFQPSPVGPAYGMDQPPPGIDPRQWAMMSPEQKRMMMMGRG